MDNAVKLQVNILIESHTQGTQKLTIVQATETKLPINMKASYIACADVTYVCAEVESDITFCLKLKRLTSPYRENDTILRKNFRLSNKSGPARIVGADQLHRILREISILIIYIR